MLPARTAIPCRVMAAIVAISACSSEQPRKIAPEMSVGELHQIGLDDITWIELEDGPLPLAVRETKIDHWIRETR